MQTKEFKKKLSKDELIRLGFDENYEGEVLFKICAPNVEHYKKALRARNEAVTEAISAKAPLRQQINTLLRNRGEWDDEREKQYNDLSKNLLDKERILKKGGISLNKAKEIALSMKEIRGKLQSLLADRSALDSMTVEGQADNAHFNMLLIQCTAYVNSKGQETPYFSSSDDYLVYGGSEVGVMAASLFAGMLYSIGDDLEKSLPENKFLLKYKFIDEKLRPINKEGKLVDKDGRLIDENGFYIDENGARVDKYGNLVDENGEYIIESLPFTDEDGNAITE
jgi:hypothetical protein